MPAAHGGPSESVVSGEVGSSRPPIMRPGIAPGRAAAAGVASCTRRAIRVSHQWRGWQLAPANYATRDSTRAGSGSRGLPAAHGGPSAGESVVSGEVHWQLAPANFATRDSTRASRGIRVCQLHTTGHLSQSSVARLARTWQFATPIMRPGIASARAGAAEHVSFAWWGRAIPHRHVVALI